MPGPGQFPIPYREHQPAHALRPYVECYWSQEPTPLPLAEPAHRVLPDGCMDIIFALQADGARGENATVVGTMTRPLIVPNVVGGRFIAVRFRPGQAFHALGIPATTLTNRAAALDDVWSDRGETLERLLAARTIADQVRVLDGVLARRLLTRLRADAVVDAAVGRIVASRGRIEIASLAQALGVTRQHLARRFGERVGVAPKMLARVMRLQSVVRRIVQGEPADWSGLAYEFGYFDQSHLVGEFKALVGLTPGDYAQSR